jgi:hypothetical protein
MPLSKQKPYITGANLIRQRRPFLHKYRPNLYCIKIIPSITILPINVYDKEKEWKNIRSDTVHYIPYMVSRDRQLFEDQQGFYSDPDQTFFPCRYEFFPNARPR